MLFAYASHKCQSEIGPGLFGGLWLPYTNLQPWRVYAKSEVPDQTGTGSASTKLRSGSETAAFARKALSVGLIDDPSRT